MLCVESLVDGEVYDVKRVMVHLVNGQTECDVIKYVNHTYNIRNVDKVFVPTIRTIID